MLWNAPYAGTPSMGATVTDIRLTGRCGATGKPIEILVTPENLQALRGVLYGAPAKDPLVKTIDCEHCGSVVANEQGMVSDGARVSGAQGRTLCRECLEKEKLTAQISKLQQRLQDMHDRLAREELSHDSAMGDLERNLEAAERLLEEEKEAREEAEHKLITKADEVVRRLTVELYDMIYAGEDLREREPRWKWVVLGVSNLIDRIKEQEAELDVIQGKAEDAQRKASELQKKLDSAVATGATEIQIADKLGAENKGLQEQVEKLKEALKRSTVKAVCWGCRTLLYDAGEVIRCVDGKDFCQKCFAARRAPK